MAIVRSFELEQLKINVPPIRALLYKLLKTKLLSSTDLTTVRTVLYSQNKN